MPNVGHYNVMTVNTTADVSFGAIFLCQICLSIENHAVVAEASNTGGDDIAIRVKLQRKAVSCMGRL